MSLRRVARGFTLLELMIVLVVMAVLLAMALPAYEAQMLRANRSEAMDELARIAQAQERFLFTHGRYAGSLAAALGPDPVTSGLGMRASTRAGESDDAYYDLELELAGPDGTPDTLAYVLRAHPRGTRQSVDACGTLVLTSSGARSAQQPGCW